jgi:hypothetical protein
MTKRINLLAVFFLAACGSGSGSGAGGSGGSSSTGGAGGGAGGASIPDAARGGGGGSAGGVGGGGGMGGTAGRDAAATGGASGRDASPPGDVPPLGDASRSMGAPASPWMEHWFEHVQSLKLVDYNDDVAVYFDDDVPRTGTDWILPFMTKLWQYSKITYNLPPDSKNRLFTIFHQGKYGGGHPSTYFDASHDNRNVTDCGPGPWTGNGTGGVLDIPSHEAGHVVESANNGIHGSPAFPIWGDSKWMEFYQYDVYKALGLDADAQRLFTRFTNTTDSFPRAGTRWFRDWFYPLWRDHGGAQVMVRFFKLLSMYFPKNGTSYSRDLNMGEFVHFMSGAAGTNLKDQATMAFGWPAASETQFNQARTTFSMITY